MREIKDIFGKPYLIEEGTIMYSDIKDVVEIGSVFSRVDRNGRKHKLIVARKMNCYVNCDIYNPYTNETIPTPIVDGKYTTKLLVRYSVDENRYFIPTKYGAYYLEKEGK